MAVIALGTSSTPVRLPYVYSVGETRLLHFAFDAHIETGESIVSVAFAAEGSYLTVGEDFGPVTLTDSIDGGTYTSGYGVLLTGASAGVETITATVTIDNPNTTAHRVSKPKVEIQVTS